MRSWFLAAALIGCSLPDKVACRTPDDCLAGRACVDGVCVAGQDLAGADLASPGDLGAVDDLADGCTAASCPAGTCEAGVCLAGRWTAAMSMPTARHGLAALFAGDGRLYALGGYGNAGTVVEAYDPAGDAWSSAKPMPHARSSFGAVLGADGLVYAVGGPYGSASDPGVSHLVDSYAPASDTWSPAASLSAGRSGVAAALGSDGAIYAVGGLDQGTFAVNDSVERLSGGAWTTLTAHLLTARQDHVVAFANGRLYALGGLGGTVGPRLAASESLAVGGTAFVSATPLTQARTFFAAAVAGGRIFVFGGLGTPPSGDDLLGLVEAYDPATQSWSRVASLPTPRHGLAAAAGPDGKLYVVGGYDGTRAVPTLEVLTP